MLPMTRPHDTQWWLHKVGEPCALIWTPTRIPSFFLLEYTSKMGAQLVWWYNFSFLQSPGQLSYACPNSLVPIFLLVCLDLVIMESPSIKHNGYLCWRKPPVETLSLYPLPHFAQVYWEADTSPVLILAAEYQIVFNVIGTPHLSMESMDGLPNSNPKTTHTTPTLWRCNNFQDPCLPLRSLTLEPPNINTAVIYLLIPLPQTFLKTCIYLHKKTGIL